MLWNQFWHEPLFVFHRLIHTVHFLMLLYDCAKCKLVTNEAKHTTAGLMVTEHLMSRCLKLHTYKLLLTPLFDVVWI